MDEIARERDRVSRVNLIIGIVALAVAFAIGVFAGAFLVVG